MQICEKSEKNYSLSHQTESCMRDSKRDRIISVHFQGKPFNIPVIQVCAPTSNAEEAEVEWFYEDLQDLIEL